MRPVLCGVMIGNAYRNLIIHKTNPRHFGIVTNNVSITLEGRRPGPSEYTLGQVCLASVDITDAARILCEA